MDESYPEYFLLEGRVVRASETPDGGLESSVWRNGAWERGGNFVEASWSGRELSPEAVAALLGPEAAPNAVLPGPFPESLQKEIAIAKDLLGRPPLRQPSSKKS